MKQEKRIWALLVILFSILSIALIVQACEVCFIDKQSNSLINMAAGIFLACAFVAVLQYRSIVECKHKVAVQEIHFKESDLIPKAEKKFEPELSLPDEKNIFDFCNEFAQTMPMLDLSEPCNKKYTSRDGKYTIVVTSTCPTFARSGHTSKNCQLRPDIYKHKEDFVLFITLWCLVRVYAFELDKSTGHLIPTDKFTLDILCRRKPEFNEKDVFVGFTKMLGENPADYNVERVEKMKQYLNV